jgi:Protein of unknown function (DUF3308).
MPYTTYGVSYDRTIQAIKSGIGFNIVSDVEGKGIFSRTSVDFVYAYGIQPSYNSHLRFGLQTSVIMRTRNYSGLVFPDMLDIGGNVTGTQEYPGFTSWNYDFSLGVAGDYDNFMEVLPFIIYYNQWKQRTWITRPTSPVNTHFT